VRVLWKDAIEGPLTQNSGEEVQQFHISGSLTCDVSTIGRFLKISDGYLVLTDVFQEESDGKVLFEKQSGGKWLSVPLSSVKEISLAGDVIDAISKETRRRRTVLRQLRFIPRARRLPTGEVSRMLYVV